MKRKSTQTSRLFRTSSIRRRNFPLNFMNNPQDEFGPYAEAYHRAAKILAKRLHRASGYMDTDALPVVFLYRHALELTLKAILLVGFGSPLGEKYKITADDIKAALASHSLAPMFLQTVRVFKAAKIKWCPDIPGFSTEAEMSQSLREFDKIDRKAVAFRYPTDRQLDGNLRTHFCFDLFDFAARMDLVLSTLNGARFCLEDLQGWDYGP
jgi:hypothetical protein